MLQGVRAIAFALFVFCFAHPHWASAQGVTVSREAESAIDRQAVMGLPVIELKIGFDTSHGRREASYSGGILWAALQSAGVLAGLDERARLSKSITVIGKDGYRATLSLAEIDPEFEGKQVLLAYRRDGAPLPDNELRLIVPGDKRGGRSVRHVVRIELR